jgi:hypothetical protein
MEKCVNNGYGYFSDKRKNKCIKLPYRYSINVCECHRDDNGYSENRPKGESPWTSIKEHHYGK